MSCDIGTTAEGLENELWRRWSNCRPVEWAMTKVKQRKGWRMSCDGASFSNPYIASPTSQLILQPFRRITYVTAHSTALPLLHLHHRDFTYCMSPGELPRPLWWCLIYPWWFCNLQWLRPAGWYERCKLALELKRLKTPGACHMNFNVIFI